jgi:hypothetical protein
MSTVHSNTADAFTPEDFGVLVNLAVQAKSIAASSATVFGTDKVKVNFPLWESDPAVGWYNGRAVPRCQQRRHRNPRNQPSRIGLPQ